MTAYDPYNSIKFDPTSNYFLTDNHLNTYICYEFKNHRIIPTHYKIRSRPDGYHSPLNFRIEISIDGFHWEVIHDFHWKPIDGQNNALFQDGVQGICEFFINEGKHKECKFIRLPQTGKNSSKQDYLAFQSIEYKQNSI